MTAEHSAAGAAHLAITGLMLSVVPAILQQLLRDALTPGDSENYEDPEKMAKTFGKATLNELFGMFLFAREIGEFASVAAGFEDYRGYEGPAGLRVLSDLGKFAAQAHQGEFDDAWRKAMINLLGSTVGWPAAALNRFITGVNAIMEGDVTEPTEVIRAPLFGYQEPR